MALTSPSVSKTVHFVGSICLPDTPTVFQELCLSLSPHLRRIPDGETGKRGSFIQFQKDIFAEYPFLLRETISAPAEEEGLSEAQKSIEINLKPLEYDQFAISSYKEFCKLRDEGAIPQHVRFQVCLPTPINIVCNLVHSAWRAKVELIYEKAMLGVLRRIQDSIPAKDLSIQFDAPSEFAYLEGVATVPVDWFSPVKEGLIERMVKLALAVDDGVELGFHFCYGDFGHKHFTEPKDAGLMVEVGTALLHAVPRPINWIHMPVPKDRTDAAYFSPLKELELGTTELYLGLLHMNDEQGTRKRKEEAKKIVSEFGISTECGMGRATEDELNSVLQVAKKILN